MFLVSGDHYVWWGHVCHIVKDNTSLFCHLGLGESLSPVVGLTRWWQGNGQIGDKTWAKAFSEKNVSCLTCLSQLKCLHLKQNYSIVNHNELQSLRSLPARHKRKEEGANSLRKFRVAQVISGATYLLYHWEYLQVFKVQSAVIYSCCLSHYWHTASLSYARMGENLFYIMWQLLEYLMLIFKYWNLLPITVLLCLSLI